MTFEEHSSLSANCGLELARVAGKCQSHRRYRRVVPMTILLSFPCRTGLPESLLKCRYGGRWVRVRGAAKVMSHLNVRLRGADGGQPHGPAGLNPPPQFATEQAPRLHLYTKRPKHPIIQVRPDIIRDRGQPPCRPFSRYHPRPANFSRRFCKRLQRLIIRRDHGRGNAGVPAAERHPRLRFWQDALPHPWAAVSGRRAPHRRLGPGFV